MSESHTAHVNTHSLGSCLYCSDVARMAELPTHRYLGGNLLKYLGGNLLNYLGGNLLKYLGGHGCMGPF